MSRELKDLTPKAQDMARRMLEHLRAISMRVSVIETLRSKAIQEAYFSQGRDTLDIVNAKRELAGLYRINQKQNVIITQCDGINMRSKHQDGEALDIAPMDKEGRIWWNAPQSVWEMIGEVGEAYGFEWGGRWGAKDGKLGWDCPHYEVPKN